MIKHHYPLINYKEKSFTPDSGWEMELISQIVCNSRLRLEYFDEVREMILPEWITLRDEVDEESDHTK